MIDSQPSPARRSLLSAPIIIAGLLALTLGVFAPALDNGFVNLDDNVYVTNNPMVLRGIDSESVAWAATANVASNWHPLTMLSHMADVELFGLEPRGHHLTSVLLHAINVALLFVVLRRLTGHTGRSAAVAVLFAVHPTRVESVAWIAERKDVLSTAFWLLTMLAYVVWRERPTARRYLLIASLLALGLMAKPMLVTLPCVLLLLDVWPLRRLDHDRLPQARPWLPLVREKLPLFILVGLFCGIAIATQGSALDQVETRPLAQRLGNAANAYTWYAAQTAIPRDLAVYYPFQAPKPSRALAAMLFLAAITVAVIVARRRAPYGLVGWFWYLGTLIPVIGLLPVGGQARADRYTYVPTIGLLIAVVWCLHAWLSRYRHHRWILPAATIIATLILSVATRSQISYWFDSETLFRRALAVTKNNEVAHLNLAEALSMQSNPAHQEEALKHYQAVLDAHPAKADYHAALGSALGRFGRPEAAREALIKAVELAPDDPRMHHALAMVLDDLGESTAAREHLERAVTLDPHFAPGQHGLGAFHDARGNYNQAITHYRAALDADPSRNLYGRLGLLLGQQGALAESAGYLHEAANRRPNDATVRFNLGVTQAQLGDLDAAIASLRAATDLAPGNPQINAMLRQIEAQRAQDQAP